MGDTRDSDYAHLARAMRQAQRAWAQISLDERARILGGVADDLAAAADALVTVVTEETGKLVTEAWFSEVVGTTDVIPWWNGPGRKHLQARRVPMSSLKFPGKRAVLHQEPRGLIGLITPWNYPVALPLRSLVPALLAGNAVLFKPSEVTPRSGSMLAAIFNRHLPGGILAIAQGGAAVGRAVVDVSDHVIFTGGVAAGREVSMRCAEQLKTVSLELGGKDAAIVLKDCDVARTAQGIFWGAMTNSGQNCASIERVYVEQPVHDALVQRLCALAASTRLAPVATSEQEALVQRHLEDARDRGANLHGEYPGATILTHVPEDALILQEETFGPACPVVAVKDADDALRRANQSRFGLTTSIWTRDQARARRLARAADSGVVTINNVGFTAALPFVPWSGRRHSGHGTTNSPQSLYGLVQSKLIVEDTSSAPEPWWFPLGDEALALARETLRWLMASFVRKVIMLPGVMLAQRRRSRAQAKALKRLHSGMDSETD